VRLLGEDLVVFRDTKGRLGVLDEHCPHRRASLALGRNEECGLRCLYHGWKMDVDGNILDASSEPPGSRVTENIKVKSYPTAEGGGLVWVYMGPREEMTPFEPPAFAPSPDIKVSICKIRVSCNWAQILEGAIDSAHSSTLHSSEIRTGTAGDSDDPVKNLGRPSTDTSPRLEVEPTPYGFRYAAIRVPTYDADTHDYLRITAFIAPGTVLIPPGPQHGVAQLTAPEDDTHTMFYFMAWGPSDRTPDNDAWRQSIGAQVGVHVDEAYRNLRTRANGYLQDREAMKKGSFTGLPGIAQQDIAMWETMGPIADRSLDRLGTSDIAIAQFRRIMVRAARRVAEGGTVIGISEPRMPQAHVHSFAGLVPKSTDWRDVATEKKAEVRPMAAVAAE
jgi:phthalate 4,5-dioxygenase oxygenase subunit